MIVKTGSRFAPFVNLDSVSVVRNEPQYPNGAEWAVTLKGGVTLHFTPDEFAPLLVALEAAGKTTRRAAVACNESEDA